MEQLPEQVYTSEYRRQAVAMIARDKLSVAEVSRKLPMSQKTLADWVKRAKSGDTLRVVLRPSVSAVRVWRGAEA